MTQSDWAYTPGALKAACKSYEALHREAVKAGLDGIIEVNSLRGFVETLPWVASKFEAQKVTRLLTVSGVVNSERSNKGSHVRVISITDMARKTVTEEELLSQLKAAEPEALSEGAGSEREDEAPRLDSSEPEESMAEPPADRPTLPDVIETVSLRVSEVNRLIEQATYWRNQTVARDKQLQAAMADQDELRKENRDLESTVVARDKTIDTLRTTIGRLNGQIKAHGEADEEMTVRLRAVLEDLGGKSE